MRISPLAIPLQVELDEGARGVVIALGYNEHETRWPNDAELRYIVAMHGQAQMRIIAPEDVREQSVG